MGCAGAGAVASPRRERRVQDTPLSPEPARIAPETLRSVGSASSSLCAFVEEENDEANINGLGLQRFVHNRQGLLESSSAGMSPAIRISQLMEAVAPGRMLEFMQLPEGCSSIGEMFDMFPIFYLPQFC